jgi:hypothetical protein
VGELHGTPAELEDCGGLTGEQVEAAVHVEAHTGGGGPVVLAHAGGWGSHGVGPKSSATPKRCTRR